MCVKGDATVLLMWLRSHTLMLPVTVTNQVMIKPTTDESNFYLWVCFHTAEQHAVLAWRVGAGERAFAT